MNKNGLSTINGIIIFGFSSRGSSTSIVIPVTAAASVPSSSTLKYAFCFTTLI